MHEEETLKALQPEDKTWVAGRAAAVANITPKGRSKSQVFPPLKSIITTFLSQYIKIFISFYSGFLSFKLGVTVSAIGMVFIQYERCSHVKIVLLYQNKTKDTLQRKSISI